MPKAGHSARRASARRLMASRGIKYTKALRMTAQQSQHDPAEPADPAGRILARLRTALLGRWGHLCDADGMPPPATEVTRSGCAAADAEISAQAGRPGSDLVGWRVDVNGERRLLLIPERVLTMLRQVAEQCGESFEETVSSAGAHLRQSGVGLAAIQEQPGMMRNTVLRVIPGGNRLWVWDLPESILGGGSTGHEIPALGYSAADSLAPRTPLLDAGGKRAAGAIIWGVPGPGCLLYDGLVSKPDRAVSGRALPRAAGGISGADGAAQGRSSQRG
jgi:hypothetical protein